MSGALASSRARSCKMLFHVLNVYVVYICAARRRVRRESGVGESLRGRKEGRINDVTA